MKAWTKGIYTYLMRKIEYVIEIKHYCDDHLTSKVLTGKDPQLLQFWQQTVRETNQSA